MFAFDKFNLAIQYILTDSRFIHLTFQDAMSKSDI